MRCIDGSRMLDVKQIWNLADKIGNFYVVGGLVRRMINDITSGNYRESTNQCDIDIISPIWEPWQIAKGYANQFKPDGAVGGGDESRFFTFEGRRFNVLRSKGSLHAALEEFDFTCCLNAYDTAAHKWILSEHFTDTVYLNLKPTRSLLETRDRGLSKRSWCRAAKLIREGYTMSQEVFLQMADAFQELHCPLFGHGPSMQDVDVVCQSDSTEEVVF